MSVAKCLGVDDVDGPALAAAAVAWQRWCHQDPELAVVDDLLDVPGWTRRATTASKDALLARLHRLAQDDAEAATVLAWLLLPGATRLADSLRDLSPDIDALTAGELWIQIRTRPPERCVAATILRSVRRALLTELGVGDAARRSDPTWASTTPREVGDLARFPEPDLITDPEAESGYLVQAAVLDGVVTDAEVSLLLSLAEGADERRALHRRGRAGLTTPEVVDVVAALRPVSTRTVRRQVADILERLGSYARDHKIADDLHDYLAAHDLPPVSPDEFLDLHGCDHVEEDVAERRASA